MIDTITLGLVYLIGSCINYQHVRNFVEENSDQYNEGWDYMFLIATFLFWPVVSILVLMSLPSHAYRGFKHSIKKPRK